MSEATRGRMIDLTIDAVAWCRARRSAFTARDFATGLGLRARTAQRWLNALEAAGIVELHREVQRTPRPSPALWRLRT